MTDGLQAISLDCTTATVYLFRHCQAVVQSSRMILSKLQCPKLPGSPQLLHTCYHTLFRTWLFW